MGGQMRGGGGYGADGNMAAWLELRERRIRALEAENQELRRQLDDLRRGIGIAVLIDGHPVPLAASAAPLPDAAPVMPTDTRPAATAQRPVQRPHVSPPAGLPHLQRANAPLPHGSGYAFEQPWPSASAPAPHAPLPGPSLPSMPTTQSPIPVAQPLTRRPNANDSSWLTDERPAVPSATTRVNSGAPMASGTPNPEDAWLRSGAAWPQPAPRPPAHAAAPTAHSARSTSVPRVSQGEPAPAERNVFADSFIL